EQNWAKNVYWMYAISIEPKFRISRDQLAERLAASGIETRTFFCPMNQQPFLQKMRGFRGGPLPVADRLWRTGLYLPSTYTLSDDQVTTVCRAVEAARG